tara:strand:+ start:207 stop:530 length:324 start_codon:yes stop_codon:yes gene_type:complete
MLTYIEKLESGLKGADETYNRWLKKDKDQGCEAVRKDIVRYKALISFAKLGLKLEGRTHVTIADKFEYILSTGRWRVLGKNKWYWSKSPEQFYKKYVLRQEPDTLIT